jgi:hypothetical protein
VYNQGVPVHLGSKARTSAIFHFQPLLVIASKRAFGSPKAASQQKSSDFIKAPKTVNIKTGALTCFTPQRQKPNPSGSQDQTTRAVPV